MIKKNANEEIILISKDKKKSDQEKKSKSLE
jgi:hypothetical protein